MALYEQFWDCPACGTTGISALRQLKCPNCTHTKTPQDTAYHTGREITDPVGIALARGAPHWTCDHCGNVNLGAETVCQSCGNEKDEMDTSFQVRELGGSLPLRDRQGQIGSGEMLARADSSGTNTGQLPRRASQANSGWMPSNRTVTRVRRHAISERQIAVGVGVLVVIAIASLAWLMFHTDTVHARVTGFSWSREVVIQEYRAVHESGWWRPPGAYNVSASTRIRGYEPIYENRTVTERISRTCYRDLGTGATESYDCSYTTTRSERVKVGDRPIYDTWYEYDIDKWVYDRTVPAKRNDRNPYWPEYTLSKEGQTVIGAERVGSTSETYIVYFIEDDAKEPKSYTLNVPEAEWHLYQEGELYPLEVGAFGSIRNNPLVGKERTP